MELSEGQAVQFFNIGSTAVSAVLGTILIVGLLAVFLFGLRLVNKSQQNRDLLR